MHGCWVRPTAPCGCGLPEAVHRGLMVRIEIRRSDSLRIPYPPRPQVDSSALVSARFEGRRRGPWET